ncbi:sirohydrochlorin chelatase [Kibdelosporangium philippinense]|uniref:Sirohydrochlorin chelatase n=1 Tax=Kibdelosporangium philippinense TaxID=211113 RepID=A0ABS8ZKS3_9PSEU|nr:sirohydrochlorin chelatase [Kibdelosporangium philippinense]MCE7008393.1 sirohydrochlorin chelatase [Kibdelosporangium philippinense]
MTLVLAAHGTRDPAGSRVIYELAERVRVWLPDVDVRVAFADVCSPNVTDVLRTVDGPAVVVPAFLASGYHVRVDIPAQVRESGHRETVVTDPFGPSPSLVAVVHSRLIEAGWTGEPIVLAAAGSSDSRALDDVQRAARLLRTRVGVPVEVGYVTTASPRVTDLVRDRRLAIASWLLAPGLFHGVVRDAGASVAAEPIGAHSGAVELVVRRYRNAYLPTGAVSLPLVFEAATQVPARSFCAQDSLVG